MDEPIRGKTTIERTIHPGEACPGCREVLHVEAMGTFAQGRMLIYIKCQCRRWRVKHVVFEPRISPEPSEFDELTEAVEVERHE